MEKIELIRRAKMYMELLLNGVQPITGQEIPEDSAFMDGKMKRCFEFVSRILDEYVELSERVEKLEKEREKHTIVVSKKQEFSITQTQCENIRLSKEPITILSFMKNINSVIDSDAMEKLTATRINKWLTNDRYSWGISRILNQNSVNSEFVKWRPRVSLSPFFAFFMWDYFPLQGDITLFANITPKNNFTFS